MYPVDLLINSRAECIVYTWDYHSSVSFWSGLRVQPIFVDEVQTFKALITVHKVLQEGHPVVYIASYKCASEKSDVKIQCRPSKRRRVRHLGWRPVQEQSEQRVREVCDVVLDVNVFHNMAPRIWTFDPCLCSIHSGQTPIPSLATRIQWFIRVRGIYFAQRY